MAARLLSASESEFPALRRAKKLADGGARAVHGVLGGAERSQIKKTTSKKTFT